MGLPLGPASANLLMSCLESQLLKHDNVKKVPFYKRYFDGSIFYFFKYENEVNNFFRFVNR